MDEDSVLWLDFQPMDEHLEHVFSSMIRQNDVLNAIEFITSIDIHFLPSKSVMHTIIFDILMKNEDIKCLAFASNYLSTMLKAYPSTSENRLFYYDSIRGRHGVLGDLWNVFCCIVQSYFYHREIYIIDKDQNGPEPIKYPNCKFLLEYYVRLFAVDLENIKCGSFDSCLMVKLLWSHGEIRVSNQSEQLLKWINDIYNHSYVNDMGDLLGTMHELLGLMVRCYVRGSHSLPPHSVCCNASLAEIVEAIINFCKSAFTSLTNVKLFLNLLPFKYLKAKVSEKIIAQIIKQSSRRTFVLTLRDIVDQYMFPKKQKAKCLKVSNRELNSRKKCDKKMFEKRAKTTKLHELCRKNKFGDLLQELLSSCADVNTRDHTGSTPLHEAVKVGSSMCVKLIIEQATEASCALDIAAINLEGFTPLHLAVRKNDTSTASNLLQYGGSDLLTVADSRGRYPSYYSKSEDMDKLLHEYSQMESNSEHDSVVENLIKEAPNLKSFKDYSIYLHALNCLLCSYCDIFNVYDFIWKKNTVVQNHSNKTCCHYIDEDVCSVDAALITEMPDLIETFILSICKNASKLNINIELELIPFKLFAESLKVS